MKTSCCWVLILGLLGCSRERTDEGSGVIRLQSELEASVVSRGVVDNATQLAGVQFLRQDGSVAPSTFVGATVLSGLRSSVGGITFAGADPVYDNAGLNSYFVAYHPVGVPESEEVVWTIDGKTDIVVSSVFDAGNKDMPVTGPMLFKHRLAQLEVVCKADPGAQEREEDIQNLWGKVTKIELVDTPTELVYSYATNLVTRGEALGALALKQKDYDTDFADVAITKNTESVVMAAGMFVAGLATDQVAIKVYTERAPSGKVVQVQLKNGEVAAGFEVGKCHTVTLLFKGADQQIVVAGTKVSGWGLGGAASVDVALVGQLGALTQTPANPIAAAGAVVTVKSPSALAGLVWSGSTDPAAGFEVGAFSGSGVAGSAPVTVLVNPTNAVRSSVFTATAPNGSKSTLTLTQAASALISASASATTPVGKDETSVTFTVTGTSGLTLSFAKAAGSDAAFSAPSPATLTCNGTAQTVSVSMAANTGAAREAVYTATVTNPGALGLDLADITVKQAGPDYVTIGSLKWAKGNLVAVNANECKIGAPGDGGLYFQFGSLVGWTGGASGNGVGVTNTSLSVDQAVWPLAMGTTKPSFGWQYADGSNVATLINFYFNYSVAPWATGGQDIRGFSEPFTGDAGSGNLGTGRYAKQGVGDPCTYYLGAPWRTPTTAEYVTLDGQGRGGWVTSPAAGRWFGVNAGTASSSVFFPASGFRDGSNGAFNLVGSVGSYWSSSVGYATSGYRLYFESVYVASRDYNNRSVGMPVRCVASS